MKKIWRFLDTGANSGHWNMAVDEAILNIHLEGLTLPTLRVFRWSPPAMSLGYSQNIEKVNLEKCKSLGIDVVRRPTGGSAVLHKEELTYSIVSSEKFGTPLSLRESYSFLNRGLIAAYKILGVEVVSFVSPNPHRSESCFQTSGLTDLAWRGKKLIGSVWMKRETAVLQHGSLPIKQEPELFFSLFHFPLEEKRNKTIEDFRSVAASLSEIVGEIPWEDLKEALMIGFQDALGIELVESDLCEKERTEAERLLPGYQNFV